MMTDGVNSEMMEYRDVRLFSLQARLSVKAKLHDTMFFQFTPSPFSLIIGS